MEDNNNCIDVVWRVQGGMGEAAAVAMDIVKQFSGLVAARQFYRQMLKLPPAGGSLHHAILDMEEAALSTSDCLSEPQLTQLYEVRQQIYFESFLLSRYCSAAT